MAASGEHSLTLDPWEKHSKEFSSETTWPIGTKLSQWSLGGTLQIVCPAAQGPIQDGPSGEHSLKLEAMRNTFKDLL